MPNKSASKDNGLRNTGQGAIGMGSQPSDDPRDAKAGGEGRILDDDRGSRTDPIGGAFGPGPNIGEGGGSAGNETVGPMGDKGVVGDLDAAAHSARRQTRAGRTRQS